MKNTPLWPQTPCNLSQHRMTGIHAQTGKSGSSFDFGLYWLNVKRTLYLRDLATGVAVAYSSYREQNSIVSAGIFCLVLERVLN